MFTDVDAYVGKRVRHRRWVLGMPQRKLADAVGVRFQQIQKYETGVNRIGASRLWEIAQALEVPVAFFFEGLGDQAKNGADAQKTHLLDRDALNFARTYYQIPKPQRRVLFDLARMMCSEDEVSAARLN